MEDQELRKKFAEDGYIVVRGGLTEDLVAHVTREIGGLLRGLDAPQRRAFPFQGSMVPALPLREPWSRLIADEAILGTLRRLGAADLRWLSGYLISKPPRSPRLWWHQDWWAWKDELSFADMPPQISVLTYPAGSSTESGCLRVIPGSHRRRHRLHSVLPPAHTEEINRLPADHPAFEDQEDEVGIPLAPHDFVVCDVRLLHSTHANTTAGERPGVVLWYLPDHGGLPPAFRSHYSLNQCQPSEEERRASPELNHLLIPRNEIGGGSGILLDRTPGEDFDRRPVR
ncbi:phytanoyl-CoA dioxygenase family protein [Streptomyces sudanensis]|uniref:phytanoyl-CoA dioxygenase family protein n=1 Tax=Streptomyces sudanensis TaxID=436397 RepID=UPI0020CEF0C2|nr:phytanoyl-CoA dioxygenase family protein [Streptomyces sudanensis]MCQ0000555.1 phytanoyl-CoA dioxygenase family protein [Streptomyces sudanensis]